LKNCRICMEANVKYVFGTHDSIMVTVYVTVITFTGLAGEERMNWRT